MNKIGQYEQNWTKLGIMDKLGNMDKIGQCEQNWAI